MTKSPVIITEAIPEAKAAFPGVYNHPTKPLKLRYERRKARESLPLGSCMTDDIALPQEGGGTTMTRLRRMFFHDLAEMHHSEGELVAVLPELQAACSSEELQPLRRLVSLQAWDTCVHSQRIERIFEFCHQPLNYAENNAIENLLGEWLANSRKRGSVSFMFLFPLVVRLQHYKVATYGCLRDWAIVLEEDWVAALLHDSLMEAKALDTSLRHLAREHKIPVSDAISLHESVMSLARILSRQEREVLRRLTEGLLARPTQNPDPAVKASRQAKPAQDQTLSVVVA